MTSFSANFSIYLFYIYVELIFMNIRTLNKDYSVTGMLLVGHSHSLEEKGSKREREPQSSHAHVFFV